jgi:hypothetical protein
MAMLHRGIEYFVVQGIAIVRVVWRGKQQEEAHWATRGWKSLKLLSIELSKPLQGLVIEALNDMLRKHGRAPDVSGPDPDKE